ncbi:MAG: polysulfide reductase NrfD [Bacteroidales bacterium]|nr:polysulfide reductase NrfD [Bacteroidales bacterium]MCF8334720.1 polysulfide reductase NrfD [Bacteroidales bacterium]
MKEKAHTLYPPHKTNGTLGFLLNELKPKGKIFTVFNMISLPIMLVGIFLIYIRFSEGLGAVTNLTQQVPWGLWIGFDVVTGVAFAGGAYVLAFLVYILNIEKFKPILRVTILNGFLAYLFYSGALLLDLGRPLSVINVIIGNNFGVSSVMFLVGWHFLLYMLALLLEFSPAIAEWLNAKKARRILSAMTLGAVIFGITLSVLHQSGIGALFLMAKDKIHPLWYNSYLPLMFVVSSIFGGIALVIIEGSISRKVFSSQYDSSHDHNAILHGLARICAGGMFLYLVMTVLVFVHQQNAVYLSSGMGTWYLVEILGFVVVPMLLFCHSCIKPNNVVIKIAAVMTLLGILLNRMNVSIIAFRWDAAEAYVPSWQEFIVTLTIIFIEIWVFRWIVRRMPVIRKSPEWADDNH